MSAVAGQHQYACPSCGAALEVVPGTAGLACPYCGTRLGIAAPEAPSHKQDYASYAALGHPPVAELPAFTPTCARCGSTQELTAIAGRCPSCRAPLVVSDDLGGRLKQPDGIVPFVVDRDRAVAGFRAWVSSRWFAPSALKKVAGPESMRGTYLPHWGFDDRTATTYTGQRGDYYYTTETYTAQEDGRTVTRTREVRHTRWSRASGQVRRDFVDVLAAGVRAPGGRAARGAGAVVHLRGDRLPAGAARRVRRAPVRRRRSPGVRRRPPGDGNGDRARLPGRHRR